MIIARDLVYFLLAYELLACALPRFDISETAECLFYLEMFGSIPRYEPYEV